MIPLCKKQNVDEEKSHDLSLCVNKTQKISLVPLVQKFPWSLLCKNSFIPFVLPYTKNSLDPLIQRVTINLIYNLFPNNKPVFAAPLPHSQSGTGSACRACTDRARQLSQETNCWSQE
jgi:hypothetical protein